MLLTLKGNGCEMRCLRFNIRSMFVGNSFWVCSSQTRAILSVLKPGRPEEALLGFSWQQWHFCAWSQHALHPGSLCGIPKFVAGLKEILQLGLGSGCQAPQELGCVSGSGHRWERGRQESLHVGETAMRLSAVESTLGSVP